MTGPGHDLAASIEAVTRYLPFFESGEPMGRWAGGERDANGVIQMPWFEYSDEALAFFRACAGNGWVEPFAWADWTAEAEPYVSDPALLAEAGVETIRKLLTLHIRRDRFFEGHFAAVAHSGHIAAILRRLQALRPTPG